MVSSTVAGSRPIASQARRTPSRSAASAAGVMRGEWKASPKRAVRRKAASLWPPTHTGMRPAGGLGAKPTGPKRV